MTKGAIQNAKGDLRVVWLCDHSRDVLGEAFFHEAVIDRLQERPDGSLAWYTLPNWSLVVTSSGDALLSYDGRVASSKSNNGGAVGAAEWALGVLDDRFSAAQIRFQASVRREYAS